MKSHSAVFRDETIKVFGRFIEKGGRNCPFKRLFPSVIAESRKKRKRAGRKMVLASRFVLRRIKACNGKKLDCCHESRHPSVPCLCRASSGKEHIKSLFIRLFFRKRSEASSMT